MRDAPADPPLLETDLPDEALTARLLEPTLRPPGWIWRSLLLLCLGATGLFFLCIAVTFVHGIDAWGNNIPVGWAFGIANFVWWIGFGHAGTLISAVLVLVQQRWRASVNRFAETMTLCAVVQAGIFPLLHLGRFEYAYWLLPYPATTAVWPQFRSALTWDAGAVATYLIVSALFWYVGLLPDLAAARDRAPGPRRRTLFALLSLGWTGSARQWHQWRTAYLLLAGLASALVISVESIVSFDFATGLVPGWHSTIFPPYFVASAMFSGFALLLVLLVPLRSVLGLQGVITRRHLDALGKLLVGFSFMVAYGYWQENFFAWYGGDRYEAYAFAWKRTGTYAALWWGMVLATVVIPQLLWSRRLRRSPVAVFLIGLVVVAGAWLEQFQHVIPPLARDFLVSSWRDFAPTWVDLGLLAGSIGFFGLLYLLLFKLVPLVPVSDVKKVRSELAAGDRPRDAPGPPAAEVGS